MKPILFNAEMVRAILEGRKTVTRRVVKPQPAGDGSAPEPLKTRPGYWNSWGDDNVYRPPYQPGDILWVRETWAKIWYADQNGCTHYDQPMYYYAADGTPDVTLVDEDGFEKDDQRIRWRPSIHMPREAARIFLRVTGVRVERLQDISYADVIAEGIPAGHAENTKFMALWDGTMKREDRNRYGWDVNPWVWVFDFERISKEEAEQ